MLNYFRKHMDFFRTLLALSIPVALQNLLSTSMSMVDTLMIGSEGELTVAAVGICNQFSSLLFAAYWGFASGGTLFFSQYWGVKNDKGICKSYGVTLTCMMAVGLIFTLTAIIAPSFVMRMYTDKESVQAIGVEYLRIVGFSYPLQVLAVAMSGLLRSTEKVKLPLIASISSMLTNTILNYLLIAGRLGFPALGAQGAAIATCIASVVNVMVMFLLGSRDSHSYLLRLRDQFSFDKELVRSYFIKCLPIIINEVMYGVGQLIVNVVLGHQDEAGITAIAIFRVFEGFIYSFYAGLTNACSVIIGKGVGAGALKTAYQDAKRIAVLCPLTTFAICLFVVVMRPVLLSLFPLSDTAYSYIMNMLLIYTVAGTARTFSFNINNTFRAGGESFLGSCIEVGTLFVFTVPTIWLTGMVWHLPFLAVFASIYIEEIFKTTISTVVLLSGRWLKPVTPEGIAELPAFRAWLKSARKKGAAVA